MESINTGNIIPAPLVKQYSSEVQEKGFALDLGCGRGSNALYLASEHFEVTAIDRNAKALELLKASSNENNLDIEMVNQDIANFKIKENHFSFICAINSLNFLSKEEFLEVIAKIKKGLRDDGICTISLFTDEDDMCKEMIVEEKATDGESFYDGMGKKWYYPPKNFLKECFEDDSEILFYTEFSVEDKGHPGNETPHNHAIARIAIKKKR